MTESSGRLTVVRALSDDPKRTTLTTLHAQATAAYGRKDYARAAELYSDAVELQAHLNGEMMPENAELLYEYGRCLYKIGVSQSDVLGNKVAGGHKTSRAIKHEQKSETSSTKIEVERKPFERMQQVEEGTHNISTSHSKPYFELQGDDADWDDSEEDEADAHGSSGEIADDDDDDDDDDFATAYEVLDLARVLLEKKVGTHEEINWTMIRSDSNLVQCLEKLADIHDLQAEISLENENFSLAIADSRAALLLLQELHPLHNRLVAEAHFKLSLALEFASVTQLKTQPDETQEVADVDQGLRSEAAAHTAKTIESCRLRKQMEENALKTLSGEEAEEKRKHIKDVLEMLEEFEQRLEDLRAPAVPMLADPAAIFAGAFADPSTATKREEKAAAALDISSLVKHKKKPAHSQDEERGVSRGKRPVDQPADESEAKKMKFKGEAE